MVNIDKFANNLIEDIKSNNKFVLYVHIHPDCDAIGSAYALKQFIELNFDDKDVRIAGMSNSDNSYLPEFFNIEYLDVDEEFANQSVGIVFDTAKADRILKQKLFNHEISYRIDHHILVETICKHELVDSNASSTCELVALLLIHWNLKINEGIANSLYFGISTDTIRFLTSNVNHNTYDVMSYLTRNSNINKKLVHDQLYLHSLSDTKLDKKISKLIKYDDGFAYLIFNKKMCEKYNNNILKMKLYLMSNIKEIKIYFLAYYDSISKFYRCSIRSRDYDINKIAQKFNGGGHLYASGCKIMNKNEFKLLKDEIRNTLKNK